MYIELVIADNFILTFFAGTAASRIARDRASVPRVLLASVLGTAIAVLYPFMPNGVALAVVVKVSLWIMLCLIMYAGRTRGGLQSLLFLLCTFAFGGASYAVILALCGGESRAARIISECPVTVVLGSGGAVYLVIKRVATRVRVIRSRAPYEYGTVVDAFGEKMTFRAFLDTGNCVIDGKTGLPVVITDFELFTQKLNGAAAIAFMKKLPHLRKIRAATPAGSAEIYIVEPNGITVYSDRHGHKINAMVGLVSGRGAGFSPSHEMLLGPETMAEGV